MFIESCLFLLWHQCFSVWTVRHLQCKQSSHSRKISLFSLSALSTVFLITGQSGLGKSTLMNTLFKSKVSRKSVQATAQEKIPKTIEIKSISHGMKLSSRLCRHFSQNPPISWVIFLFSNVFTFPFATAKSTYFLSCHFKQLQINLSDFLSFLFLPFN